MAKVLIKPTPKGQTDLVEHAELTFQLVRMINRLGINAWRDEFAGDHCLNVDLDRLHDVWRWFRGLEIVDDVESAGAVTYVTVNSFHLPPDKLNITGAVGAKLVIDATDALLGDAETLNALEDAGNGELVEAYRHARRFSLVAIARCNLDEVKIRHLTLTADALARKIERLQLR